jgi:hypothetical protein
MVGDELTGNFTHDSAADRSPGKRNHQRLHAANSDDVFLTAQHWPRFSPWPRISKVRRDRAVSRPSNN